MTWRLLRRCWRFALSQRNTHELPSPSQFLDARRARAGKRTGLAAWISGHAGHPAVYDEVHVELIAKIWWDCIGESCLTCALSYTRQLDSQRAQCVEARQCPSNVYVDRKNRPAERVEHDAEGAF